MNLNVLISKMQHFTCACVACAQVCPHGCLCSRPPNFWSVSQVRHQNTAQHELRYTVKLTSTSLLQTIKRNDTCNSRVHACSTVPATPCACLQYCACYARVHACSTVPATPVYTCPLCRACCRRVRTCSIVPATTVCVSAKIVPATAVYVLAVLCLLHMCTCLN